MKYKMCIFECSSFIVYNVHVTSVTLLMDEYAASSWFGRISIINIVHHSKQIDGCATSLIYRFIILFINHRIYKWSENWRQLALKSWYICSNERIDWHTCFCPKRTASYLLPKLKLSPGAIVSVCIFFPEEVTKQLLCAHLSNEYHCIPLIKGIHA